MKIKFLVATILFLMISVHLFAHEEHRGDCEKSKYLAKADLKNKRIELILLGGIAPTYFAGHEKFEQKYKINYYELGCLAPSNLCIADYNKEVAKYLDEIYGKNWRKEVRKDIAGVMR